LPGCGCDAARMARQYWPHTRSCHELHTRGPCVSGHVFLYNSTLGHTSCDCHQGMRDNYHQDSRQCFPLNSRGPCSSGHVFTKPNETSRPMCSCLNGHLLNSETSTCHRAYTRATCDVGKIFVPSEEMQPGRHNLQTGVCVKVPCRGPGRLYSPSRNKCYAVGTSGPCPIGKLWVYERASSMRGKCDCDSNSVGYWPPHKACYAQNERGPCPKNHVVIYRGSKGIACSCDRIRGYVRWKNRCQKLTAQDLVMDLLQDLEVERRGKTRVNSGEKKLRSSSITRSPRNRRNQQMGRIIKHALTAQQPRMNTKSSKFNRKVIMDHIMANNQRENSETGLRKRIAKLTHRGLITRRQE